MKKIEPFVVKHYGEDPFPTIKGNGFDGLQVGATREDAEDFVKWLNERLNVQSHRATCLENALRPFAMWADSMYTLKDDDKVCGIYVRHFRDAARCFEVGSE